MIINERAGSGGDAMPWYFRRAGVGKLIGTRTWGGLVGMAGGPPLMDGGFVGAPSSGIYNPLTGEWEVENIGVPPDIEVEHRVHRRLRRRRPVHRRLSGRGGAASGSRPTSASFLIATCVLDRLTGPLCDAVTGQRGGKAMLEALDRGEPVRGVARRQPPVVPLPPPLRRRAANPARRRAPDRIPELHRRASRLVRAERRTGRRRSATRWPPATSSGRPDLVELAIPALRRTRQEATIRRLARRDPGRGRPGPAGARRSASSVR